MPEKQEQQFPCDFKVLPYALYSALHAIFGVGGIFYAQFTTEDQKS